MSVKDNLDIARLVRAAPMIRGLEPYVETGEQITITAYKVKTRGGFGRAAYERDITGMVAILSFFWWLVAFGGFFLIISVIQNPHNFYGGAFVYGLFVGLFWYLFFIIEEILYIYPKTGDVFYKSPREIYEKRGREP